MKPAVFSRLFFVLVCLTFIFTSNSCNKFKVNYHELKIIEGKWMVTRHHFSFFIGQVNEVSCDTTINETGVFEFHQTDDYGGTFTFSPTIEGRQVTSGYSIGTYTGTFQLTDLQTSVDICLYPEGGGMLYKNIKVVDFGRKEQVWYADRSLNLESGANETLYLEKTK